MDPGTDQLSHSDVEPGTDQLPRSEVEPGTDQLPCSEVEPGTDQLSHSEVVEQGHLPGEAFFCPPNSGAVELGGRHQ